MNTFVTVLTVMYPQQLWIIKGKLESEGIQCFVKDELTVQSYNLYSNAVGGVKLQVQQQDAERAVELLKELGYIKEEPVQIDLLTRMNQRTSFIPFLKNLDVTYRIIIIALIFIGLATTLLYFIFKPAAVNELTRTSWCVDRIIYKNKVIGPKTYDKIIAVSTKGDTACYENLDFRTNHDVILPGIYSSSITGNWKIDDNKVIITVDTLKDILENEYEIDISNSNNLVLKSNTTEIYAHKDNFFFSF